MLGISVSAKGKQLLNERASHTVRYTTLSIENKKTQKDEQNTKRTTVRNAVLTLLTISTVTVQCVELNAIVNKGG